MRPVTLLRPRLSKSSSKRDCCTRCRDDSAQTARTRPYVRSFDDSRFKGVSLVVQDGPGRFFKIGPAHAACGRKPLRRASEDREHASIAAITRSPGPPSCDQKKGGGLAARRVW